MDNFVFANPTKIIFGKDTQSQLADEIRPYGNKVLLHYGGGSIKKSGLYDQITAQLKNNGIEYVELGGVQPNPRLGLVYKGIEMCRNEKVPFILAVGGGSTIDSAKAIALGTANDCDVWDFFTGKKTPDKMLPLGVVLTIPAAGSESSDSAVITKEEGDYKRPCGGSVMYPRFAVLNPELTFTLPPYQTACGAADIIAHVMERYFTQTANTDLSDRMCESVLKTVINNTRIALKKPDDYNARAEIVWGGAIAHNNLLGMGRVGDWASHMIEHELSGIYDIAHGAGLAIVFPAWMQYVYRANLPRFVQFAVRVWDVDFSFSQPEQIALEGIARMKCFFKEIGLPTSLSDAGIEASRIEEMAAKAVENGPLGNFVSLGKDDIVKLLQSVV